MSKSVEYRKFADECVESARTATTDGVRKHFLDLAKMWMTAAQQIDDGIEAPPTGPAQLAERTLRDEAEMRAFYRSVGISKSTTEAAIKTRRNLPEKNPRPLTGKKQNDPGA